MELEEHVHFHVAVLGDESLDPKRRCIVRVLECDLVYNEITLQPGAIRASMIDRETTYTFPDGQVYTYYTDDVRMYPGRKAHVYLSRSL